MYIYEYRVRVQHSAHHVREIFTRILYARALRFALTRSNEN